MAPEQPRTPSYDRIFAMSDDLWQLLDVVRPGTVLVEWTKGKVGKRRHKGRGAGLAVYGAGVGGLGVAARYWIQSKQADCDLVPILENTWTRGVCKEDRICAVAQQFPSYDPAQDPGGDMGDAIGLAWYWLKQRLLA